MDSLILDIGGSTGALLIHAGADLAEAEIEISPGTDPAAARTHNQVHARQGRSGVRYTAVFPAVPAGDYTVWYHDGTPEGMVTIQGGQVTEHRWNAEGAPRRASGEHSHHHHGPAGGEHHRHPA